MKVLVKLYGNLRKRFPDYRHPQGMQIEIPDEATVKDLLASLDAIGSEGTVVVVEGRVLQEEDEIPSGIPVNVFQSIRGG